MEKKDVRFFKIIALIVCGILVIGIGSYIYNNTNHRTSSEKLKEENEAYIKSLK